MKADKEYVWFDGLRISDEQLLTMALNAGSYQLAEHYLVALLAHGVMHNLSRYLDMLNQVRENYQVMPIPLPDKGEDTNLTLKDRKRVLNDKIRTLYSRMAEPERRELIMASIVSFRKNHENMFRKKNQWQGFYLVVRDRLDYGLSQSDYVKMIETALPDGWPEKLKISKAVFKNFSRDFCSRGLDKSYFEMEHNPHGELCSLYWDELRVQILKKKKEK